MVVLLETKLLTKSYGSHGLNKSYQTMALEKAILELHDLGVTSGDIRMRFEKAMFRMDYRAPTAEDIEAKRFTLVTCYEGDINNKREFVVGATSKREALRLANLYTSQKGWKLWKPPTQRLYFDLFHKNYVVKARQLFMSGDFI